MEENSHKCHGKGNRQEEDCARPVDQPAGSKWKRGKENEHVGAKNNYIEYEIGIFHLCSVIPVDQKFCITNKPA